MPQLASILEIIGSNAGPRLSLGMGVGFDIPEAFRYVDEDWAAL